MGKVIKVINYRTTIGTLHGRLDDARIQQDLIDKIEVEFADLRPVPDSVQFTNGYGYVQQTQAGYERANKATKKFKLNPYTDIGNYFNSRLNCIDKQYREFGQPFYAQNPLEATLVEWYEHEAKWGKENVK